MVHKMIDNWRKQLDMSTITCGNPDCVSYGTLVDEKNHKHLSHRSEALQTATIMPKNDLVNHPKHYTSHPSGIECIQVTRWMLFNIGNAIKYLWRTDEKGDPIENLRKAIWYIEDEIKRREGV